MFYTIVSGRNDETWVATSIARSMREVLRQKYLSVKLGHDWIEVLSHQTWP